MPRIEPKLPSHEGVGKRRHPLQVVLSRPPTGKRCFLCRRPLRDVVATEEHVFPRWLLKSLDLYQHSLTLANDTSLKYGHFRVPCCSACNALGERELEGPISRAFRQGYDAVVKLDHRTLALWCVKIYYGIRFKEHLFPRDRRRPNRGRITRRRELDELGLLFMVLQGIRTNIRYTTEPWSVWVYRLKVPDPVEERFSFADLVGVSMFSIRINDVGIIVLPRDFGLVKNSEFGINFDGFLNETLHPQQFNELAARAAYYDIIRKIGVSYLVSYETPPLVMFVGSLASTPWSEWDWDEYYRVLAFISKIPTKVWQPTPDLRWTLLEDDRGNFIDVPLSAVPAVARGTERWVNEVPDNKLPNSDVPTA